MDRIAERLVGLGERPLPTMRDALETATLHEDPTTPDSRGMVAGLLADLTQIEATVHEAVESAEDRRDRATANLLDDVLDAIEERRWMLRAFLRA